MGNLDTLDNVILLLAIGADNVAQLAAQYALNSIEICRLKQLAVVRIDDDMMAVQPAKAPGSIPGF